MNNGEGYIVESLECIELLRHSEAFKSIRIESFHKRCWRNCVSDSCRGPTEVDEVACHCVVDFSRVR